MKAFKNKLIYVEGKGVIRTNLLFDKLIYSVGDNTNNSEVIDIDDEWIVVPGFIDEHIHGANNSDVMDASVEGLKNLSKTLLKEGTTTFLATTMTQSKENIVKALNTVKEFSKQDYKDCARLYGVHLEGPFICEKYKGAQLSKYIAKPNIKLFNDFNKASGNSIKIVTLACENENAIEFIKYLKSIGVVSSVGHSNATSSDVTRAIEVGLTNVTHTFNAQSPLHHREIGVVGSALLNDNLRCEVIADTIHVSVNALKLLVKSKNKDNLILITDAMRAKGVDDGVSELGGQVVYVKNGEARLEDGTLAGSVLKMNQAISNMVKIVGVDFTSAIDMASINPARVLKIDDKVGSIKVGKYADFTVLDKDFNVMLVIREGNVVYKF